MASNGEQQQGWRVVPMPIHGWAIHDSEGKQLIKDIYAEGLALRIVRAVNSHEALVVALKEAIHFMYPEGERQARAIVAANEALKLAGRLFDEES